MIVIIDYKAGNLASVSKAFSHLGVDARISDQAAVIGSASKLILPGVGHFSSTAALDARMRDAISHAIARGIPFLGICVGMQWLYKHSEEAPGTNGLGILNGSCARFPRDVKAPHVGWNALRPRGTSRLLRGVADSAHFYFTHSYRAPVTLDTCAITAYGGDFAAAVERGNVFGVQFHPEKSGPAGLRLLRNFVELAC